MKPTKAHVDIVKDKRTIRIGKRVPENAVNLAYYYNLGSNSSSKNVLAVASPKNSIDHISIEKYKNVKDLTFKDESKFEKTMEYYDNDDYSGTLLLSEIKWVERTLQKSKFIQRTKYYNDLYEEKCPEYIYVEDEKDPDYKGKIFLTKSTYTPTEYEDVSKDYVVKRNVNILQTEEYVDKNYKFPDTIQYDQDGYKGVLKKVKDSEEILVMNNVNLTKNVKLTETVYGPNATVPSSKKYTVNGKTYNIPLTNKTTTTKELRHYGITRYWGYSYSGLYGTADWKYRATRAGGKGYFTDSVPAQVPSRYGHFFDILHDYYDFTVKSAYTGNKEVKRSSNKKFFYVDETPVKVKGKPYSGKFNWVHNSETTYNPSGIKKDIYEGSEWTYDLAKTSKYRTNGKSDTLKHGGVIWGKHFAKKEKTFPPKGYENDSCHRGSEHMVMVTNDRIYKNGKAYINGSKITINGKKYNVSDITKLNKYSSTKSVIKDYNIRQNCFFTNITRTNSALAFTGGQQYSQMVIMFYKGRCKMTTATYSKTIILDAADTYYMGKCYYEGEVYKTETATERVPAKWDCTAVYSGEIFKNYKLYDGLGIYRGIAIKRNFAGNLNPTGINENEMYPNKDGVLLSDLNVESSYLIEGSNFMITDVYYENEPLYYSYMLTDYIYDLEGPDESGIYKGDSIKLIDENNYELKNAYKYKFKLEKTEFKNLYRCYVFTSFETSTNKNIYCMYNAYKKGKDVIDFGSEDFISGKKELIYVQPAYQVNKDYEIIRSNDYRKAAIKVNNFTMFKDQRRKIPIVYIVKTTDNKFKSKPIYANVINREFAFKSELKDFNGRNYIVSPKFDNIYMTAYDILSTELNLTESDLANKQFTVEFFNNEGLNENTTKVFLYTNQDGNGLVYAETLEDTGFLDEKLNEYTKKYNFDNTFKYHNNYIYSTFTVLNKDVSKIELASPEQLDNISNWFTRIKFGHFTQSLEQNNVRTKVTYAIPEFSRQYFNAEDGEPYKHIEDEKAEILNEHEIKVFKTPLFIKYDKDKNLENLVVYRINALEINEPLTVTSWSYKEGIITIEEYINDTDTVYVSYDYEEEYYIYRGYNKNGEFIDLDLNPSIYHDYLDTSKYPYTREKSYNLFNKVVYYFIKPKKIEDETLNKVIAENEYVIYHKFDDITPDDEYDLLIGKMYIRHNTSLKSTVLIDTRSNGGGMLDTISNSLRKELEPESDYYFDISYYDGEMYNENAIIVVRISKYVLLENGGKFSRNEVEAIVNKWVAYGVFAIVEYVDVINEEDRPNNINISTIK